MYEYSCNVCGAQSEEPRSVADRATLTPCATPECIGMRVKRVSRTAFALKGTGWYKDGYSSGGN